MLWAAAHRASSSRQDHFRRFRRQARAKEDTVKPFHTPIDAFGVGQAHYVCKMEALVKRSVVTTSHDRDVPRRRQIAAAPDCLHSGPGNSV